jgi:hypothetical protein
MISAVAVISTCVGLFQSLGQPQSPDKKDEPQKAPQPKSAELKRFYISAEDSCSKSDCHRGGSNRLKDKTSVCRGNEYDTWVLDRHKVAYSALSGKRAERMQEILKEKIPNVAIAPECLSCHSANCTPDQAGDRASLLKEGVTCVVCHGPFDEWVDKHTPQNPKKRDAWRALDRKEKERLYGMTDLWDPATRTELCASCHVGNAKEGKFITHDMYAAGHPPLPNIEFAAFCEEMPRHWEYLREKNQIILPDKNQTVLDIILQDRAPEERKILADSERTQVAVIGGAVALRTSLNLLVAKAQDCVDAKEAAKKSLDYALFDCGACHHELTLPSWRQERGYNGLKPGRPMMNIWPTTLARIGSRYVGKEEKDLDQHWAGLAETFSERPFGEPGQVAKAASRWANHTQELINKLKESKFDRDAQVRMKSLLLDIAGDKYLDYDSARQCAWALFMVSEELDWKKEWKDRNAKELYRSRLKQFSEPLNGILQLTMLSDKEPDYDKQLENALKAMSLYNPSKFTTAWKELDKKPAK